MVRQAASSFVVTVATSVAMLAIGGCGKKQEQEQKQEKTAAAPTTTAHAVAPAAPARTVGIKADIAGQVLDLRFGVVKDPYGSGTRSLFVGTEKGDCDRKEPKGAYVVIALPWGGSGPFPAGKPLAAPILMYGFEGLSSHVPSYLVTVTLDPVQRKKGARVTGTVDAEMIKDGKRSKIAGAFDAEMCEDFEGYEAPPKTVADGPVTGSAKGERFEAKSALVFLGHDVENKVDYLSALNFYAEPGITCANRSEKEDLIPRLKFRDLGGADSKHKLMAGTASPDGLLHIPGKSDLLMGETWIRFDSFDLNPGGVLKGSVYSREGSESQFAGSFAATVCD